MHERDDFSAKFLGKSPFHFKMIGLAGQFWQMEVTLVC